MKKRSVFLLPGIILVGVVLRIPFTTIPTVLTYVADGLGVSVNSLGILTSIPLIMFALCSSFAPKLAQKVGLERLFALVLFAMLMGSAMRLVNVPLLYVGTMILGMSIAVLNVLLPSLILANAPQRLGLLTTIYTTSMGLASALASSVAVPIVKASSWKGLILLLSFIVLLALLVWLPNTRYNHKLERSQNQGQGSLWKNKKVLALLIFGGLQSLLFYTGLTWLPTMASQAGLDQTAAGLLASIYSLISLPFSLTIPSLATSLSTQNRKRMLAVICACGALGVLLLFFQNGSFAYWLAVNLLIGIAVSSLFPYLLVSFSMKTNNPDQTAQVSGIVQSGGYLLAALGPALFGYSYELFHSWIPAVSLLFLTVIIMIASLFYVERFDKIL